MNHCITIFELNQVAEDQVGIGSNLAISDTTEEQLVKEKSKEIAFEKLKNKTLRKTIKRLQKKLIAIESGLAFIDVANKDLRTALSCDVFPIDKLDQIQTLIDHTETIVNQAKLISSEF